MSPTIPSETADDDDGFLIRDQDEIIRILSSLERTKAMLSVSFNDGGDFMLSEVLGVDPSQKAVYLDPSADPEINQRLLAARAAYFMSREDGVITRWTSKQVFPAQHADRPALRVSLPELLRRIQRRAYFRVATPIANPVICGIRVSEKQLIELALVDICAEGIGVILPPAYEPIIAKGAHFHDCRIELPGIAIVYVELAVQSVWEVEMKDHGKRKHAGLAFVSPHPRAQTLIQRYVAKLDRQHLSVRARR